MCGDVCAHAVYVYVYVMHAHICKLRVLVAAIVGLEAGVCSSVPAKTPTAQAGWRISATSQHGRSSRC